MTSVISEVAEGDALSILNPAVSGKIGTKKKLC